MSARQAALPVDPRVLTMRAVYAAGRDAANRSMRAAGRTAWSRADFNVAAREFDRLAVHAVDVCPVMKAVLLRRKRS